VCLNLLSFNLVLWFSWLCVLVFLTYFCCWHVNMRHLQTRVWLLGW
jgi:hypothetical protein